MSHLVLDGAVSLIDSLFVVAHKKAPPNIDIPSFLP
jgi:hypothetical protein